MELFMSINSAVNSFVWGPIMLVLMVGTGAYLSFRAGFIQFRYLGFVLNRTVGGAIRGDQKAVDGSNISPFQAMTTALASTNSNRCRWSRCSILDVVLRSIWDDDQILRNRIGSKIS